MSVGGKAVVPDPNKPRPKREERELIRPIVRTEKQRKKLSKARSLRDKKRGKLSGALDYKIKADRAKIVDLDIGENYIFFKLRCGYCGELLEGQGFGDLKSFVEDYLKPHKNPLALIEADNPRPANKMKSFQRTCGCGFGEIKGTVEVKIRDQAVEQAKKERFHDEEKLEHFGGVLRFEGFQIEGGQFQKTTRYLEHDYPTVFLYVCGACGRRGFARELQRIFESLLKKVDKTWKTGKTVESQEIDVEFTCPNCNNDMHITGNVKVEFPESRKQIIEAFNLWQKDAHQLVHGKTKLPLSLDFEKAFYEARKAERGGET